MQIPLEWCRRYIMPNVSITHFVGQATKTRPSESVIEGYRAPYTIRKFYPLPVWIRIVRFNNTYVFIYSDLFNSQYNFKFMQKAGPNVHTILRLIFSKILETKKINNHSRILNMKTSVKNTFKNSFFILFFIVLIFIVLIPISKGAIIDFNVKKF